jgi:hypothetical protein
MTMPPSRHALLEKSRWWTSDVRQNVPVPIVSFTMLFEEKALWPHS